MTDCIHVRSRPVTDVRIGARTLFFVFVLALTARAGWGVYRLMTAPDAQALEFPDEEQYWRMARSLAAGHGLVDEFGFRATRMPLYPAVLSLFATFSYSVVAAKVLHWVIGAYAAVLAARLGSVFFDRHVGLLAGLWVACDPFLIFFSSLLLTETFFITTLLFLWLTAARLVVGKHELEHLSISCSDRTGHTERLLPTNQGAAHKGRRYIKKGNALGWRCWKGIGLWGALCLHLRESSAGLLALLLTLLLVFQGISKKSMGGAVMAALVILLSLTPWAARNQRVTGSWTWLTHRGGISLYDGVGPQTDGSSNLGAVQQMPSVRGLGEVEWDRYFRRAAWAAMRDDPARVVRLAGIKLARMWNPVPNVETYRSRIVRICAGAWTVPTFLLAVAGVMLLPKAVTGGAGRRAIFLLLPAVYLSLLHCFFVGSVRYRLPAMPMLEILAALAVVVLLRLTLGVKSGEYVAQEADNV